MRLSDLSFGGLVLHEPTEHLEEMSAWLVDLGFTNLAAETEFYLPRSAVFKYWYDRVFVLKSAWRAVEELKENKTDKQNAIDRCIITTQRLEEHTPGNTNIEDLYEQLMQRIIQALPHTTILMTLEMARRMGEGNAGTTD